MICRFKKSRIALNELLELLKIKNCDLKILIKYFRFPQYAGFQCKKGIKQKIWHIKTINLWLEDKENLKELRFIQMIRKKGEKNESTH